MFLQIVNAGSEDELRAVACSAEVGDLLQQIGWRHITVSESKVYTYNIRLHIQCSTQRAKTVFFTLQAHNSETISDTRNINIFS